MTNVHQPWWPTPSCSEHPLWHSAQSNPCNTPGQPADGTTDGVSLVGSTSSNFSHLQMRWPASLTAPACPEARTEIREMWKCLYLPPKPVLRRDDRITETQKHRMVWSGRELYAHQVQPCKQHQQVTTNPWLSAPHWHRYETPPGMGTGQLPQPCTTPTGKRFCLRDNFNLPWNNWRTVPLVLALVPRDPPPASLQPPVVDEL